MNTFSLRAAQVPDFPVPCAWIDALRWCLAVMDPDDRDIGFAASLLAYAHKAGDLTERQVKWAEKTLSRVRQQHQTGRLRCQEGVAPVSVNVVSLPTAKG